MKSLVTKVLRVFVDAYPHVPEHRRLPVFVHLLTTLGASSYLHVCLALLLEKISSKEAKVTLLCSLHVVLHACMFSILEVAGLILLKSVSLPCMPLYHCFGGTSMNFITNRPFTPHIFIHITRISTQCNLHASAI